MARTRAQTRPATKAHADQYLAKARQFLQAAQVSLASGSFIAATGNAVHAGINAADTIAAHSVAAVWRGEHSQSADFLEGTGAAGKQAARQLRRLLPLKNRAEYDPVPVRVTEARAALVAAERLVALAEAVSAAEAGGAS
jgi:hypothetical protein